LIRNPDVSIAKCLVESHIDSFDSLVLLKWLSICWKLYKLLEQISGRTTNKTWEDTILRLRDTNMAHFFPGFLVAPCVKLSMKAFYGYDQNESKCLFSVVE
jgi:hypothetical protein